MNPPSPYSTNTKRPTMREKLDELARLREAAKITRLIQNGTAITDDGRQCGKFFETGRVSFSLASKRAKYVTAIHNAFPDLLAYVRGLEIELAELRKNRQKD